MGRFSSLIVPLNLVRWNFNENFSEYIIFWEIKLQDQDLNEYQSAQSLRLYLAKIDPLVLRKKIARYEKLSRSIRTRQQIDEDIYEVLLARESNGAGSASFPASPRYVPGGTKLYRARIIDHADEVDDVSHVWQAPPVYVSAGRLNVPREPLIYTSVNSPSTAAFEVRMQPGKIFAMITYVTKLNVSFAPIGEIPSNKYLTMAETRKLEILYRFMEDIFTQRTGPNEEHIYIAPELLVKNFFDWPVEFSQAWGYRSIADPNGNGFNLCFRPEIAKAYLKIENVLIGKCNEINDKKVTFDTLKVMKCVPGATKLRVIQ